MVQERLGIKDSVVEVRNELQPLSLQVRDQIQQQNQQVNLEVRDQIQQINQKLGKLPNY